MLRDKFGREFKAEAPVPVFKSREEVEYAISLGNIDLIIDVKYWNGGYGRKPEVFRMVEAWGKASGEIGFELWAENSKEAVEYISYLVNENRNHRFIYFRVWCLDCASRLSIVDTFIVAHHAWEEE